jgi:hypothetical protein
MVARTLFKPIQYELSQLLGDIDLGKLALPHLQRPFVWKKSAVRDLLDSMYRGFPIGYVMLWDAADAEPRFIGSDGKQHTPSQFIIDGQQRLTGLYAVMKGVDITFKDFSKDRIKIAFRPRDGKFEVADAAIERDPEYLPNITAIWVEESWEVVNKFIERLRTANPDSLIEGGEGNLRNALGRLDGLQSYPLLAVQIGHEIDEEQVAEIFLRVNSGGTPLTQADFILTMLSVFREPDRRRLEQFAEDCTVVPNTTKPSPYNYLISPSADQLLRVSVLVAFKRGRLQSVLALLRGASLDYDVTLAENERELQLDKLSLAMDEVLDLTSWHEYIKTLMSAGFRRSNEISSENNVVLVYALYLIGRQYGLSHSSLRTTIARYFFMSSLTGRYTGSFETQVTQDVQVFTEAKDGKEYLAMLKEVIATQLTSDYWTIRLPADLATSAARGPELFAYAASLCLLNARVPPFIESDADQEQKAALYLRDLFDPVLAPKKTPIERHHLFPQNYLETLSVNGPRNINQIANLSYVEWPENIEISNKAPMDYWPLYADQFTSEDLFHHALPDGWAQMNYEEFLVARRVLMARVIQKGFESIGASPKVKDELVGPPLIPEFISDFYIDPKLPFSNDLSIRKVVRQMKGNIFWYEQHMDRKVLEILHDELLIGQVVELRLMSGPSNLTLKTRKSFERFSAEMSRHGVTCQWRVLGTEKARSFHARVISDGITTFEVPPLNTVLAGAVDSVRTSEMPMQPFESAWAEECAPISELNLQN